MLSRVYDSYVVILYTAVFIERLQKMQDVKCTVCGSANNKQLNFTPGYGKYHLMVCEECGLKFILSENFETLDDDSYWDEVNKKI